MPYDHNRKVANLGDIWKHYCLAEAVAHRATAHKVGTEFKYLDTHAGAGVRDVFPKDNHKHITFLRFFKLERLSQICFISSKAKKWPNLNSVRLGLIIAPGRLMG